MKEKKGFTLIELLAVIVILAIIALIATPIIIGVIEDARKKAFENTSYGVLEGLKLDYVERTMSGTTSEEKNFTFPNSGLKLSGEEPAYGSAKIDESGNISFALSDKDKRWCAIKKSTSEKVEISNYIEKECQIKEISDGTVVYFNPETGTECDTYTEANSSTGVKIGCMKWYTFGGNNNSDEVNLLLDHNTTSTAVWNSSSNNKDSSEIDSKLENDTVMWKNELNARLITADEIAKITGNKKFNSINTDQNGWFYFDTNTSNSPTNMGQGMSKYAWLFDRTHECESYGCDISDDKTHGYWTITSRYNSLTSVWIVTSYGYLYSNFVNSNGMYGVRPVITISKSLLK